ncbi:blue light receptor [Thoreauomyces humboldtii]|nr:blue light receptor [Thoreauomyces humboldtii]
MTRRSTGLSRHVSSVITHFTGTDEGYQRLLDEIDDFLHVVSPTGSMVYCSPSVKRFLDYTPADLAGHHVAEILHREDRQSLLRTLNRCITDKREYLIHLRYQRKVGDFVLLEVKGKPLLDAVTGEVTSVVLTGREYRSKASMAIDSLLEYRIENIRLRRQLETELREKGIDAASHPLLMIGGAPQLVDYSDPEALNSAFDFPMSSGRRGGDADDAQQQQQQSQQPQHSQSDESNARERDPDPFSRPAQQQDPQQQQRPPPPAQLVTPGASTEDPPSRAPPPPRRPSLRALPSPESPLLRPPLSSASPASATSPVSQQQQQQKQLIHSQSAPLAPPS